MCLCIRHFSTGVKSTQEVFCRTTTTLGLLTAYFSGVIPGYRRHAISITSVKAVTEQQVIRNKLKTHPDSRGCFPVSDRNYTICRPSVSVHMLASATKLTRSNTAWHFSKSQQWCVANILSGWVSTKLLICRTTTPCLKKPDMHIMSHNSHRNWALWVISDTVNPAT